MKLVNGRHGPAAEWCRVWITRVQTDCAKRYTSRNNCMGQVLVHEIEKFQRAPRLMHATQQAPRQTVVATPISTKASRGRSRANEVCGGQQNLAFMLKDKHWTMV